MKTHWRAIDLFTDAANHIVTDCREIAADHSARGLLASGATAKRSVTAFDTRSKEALRQILGETANKIDHRGRKWRQAMAEVEKALNEHIQSAPDLLEINFRLARLSEPSGRDAAAKLIDWSAQDLRKQLAAFSEGWTSPRSRPWNERHAGWYALLLLLAGAIIGQIVPWVGEQLSDDEKEHSALVSTPEP